MMKLLYSSLLVHVYDSRLQHNTTAVLLLPWPAKEGSTGSILEDFTDTLTGPS